MRVILNQMTERIPVKDLSLGSKKWKKLKCIQGKICIS